MAEDARPTGPPPSGDDTTFETPAGSLLDQRIGPYRLLDVLGEGGFGVVYLAEQREPVRRRVALKIIKPGMDSKAIMARFDAERQALALMDHPNVARIFDGGQTPEGRPYFVMEYVRGRSIGAFCDRQKLAVDERVAIVIQVCQAVQHAHTKGVIHRDLKPSNILVELEDGVATPKIIDFGIAKALNQSLSDATIFTGRGEILGTPEYMSPEQTETTAGNVDARSDIYSIGVLLYELLSGRRPFDFAGRPIHESLRVLRETDPRRPSLTLAGEPDEPQTRTAEIAELRQSDPRSLARKLRGDLDWIVMRCLEKAPERRYETANGVAADLRRYLDDLPVLAGPPSTWYRMRKFTKRNRAALLGVSAILLTLGASAYGIMQKVRHDRAEETISKITAVLGRAEGRADEASSRLSAEQSRVIEYSEAREEAEALAEAAARERDDLRAFTQFLEEMLTRVGPEQMGVEGPRITLDSILDLASVGVERDFGDRPELAMRIRTTLGRAYRSLGLMDKADREFAMAARLQDEHVSTPVSLRLRADRALLARQKGELQEARSLYADLLPDMIAALGEYHDNTLWAMSSYANVLQRLRDYPQAEQLKQRILKLRIERDGERNEASLAAMHNLGTFYYNYLHDLDRGQPLLERCLALKREVQGEGHVSTLKTATNLGGLYCRKSEFETAIPLLERTLELQREALSPDDPDIIVAMFLLAEAYARTDQWEKAAEMFDAVYQIEARQKGPEHAWVLEDRTRLARAQLQLERFEDAEANARAVYDVWVRKEGVDDGLTRAAAGLLAEIYHAWGRIDEAARWAKIAQPDS